MEQINPNGICSECKWSLYWIFANTDVLPSKRPYLWTSHWEENCPCMKKAREHPPKSVEDKVMTKIMKVTQRVVRKLKQKRWSLVKNSENSVHNAKHSIVCAKELAAQLNPKFLDRENIETYIYCLNSQDKINLTSIIFQVKKENIKRNISSCILPVLLIITPHTRVYDRNSIFASPVDTLANEKAQPFQKAVSVDHLYSLVQPSFISLLMFASRLLVYSVTHSKLVLNIMGSFIQLVVSKLLEHGWTISQWMCLKFLLVIFLLQLTMIEFS